MEEPEEKQHLHGQCDCDNEEPETSQQEPILGDKASNKNSKLNNSDYTDSESDSDCEKTQFASTFTGTVIVPSFSPPVYERNAPLAVGQSLGSVSLPPQHYPVSPKHQELVWAGSSMGTMHYGNVHHPMQAVPIYSLGGTGIPGSRVSGLAKAPSVRSKSLMGSMFGSQTVSESGTDIYSFCKICQMQGTDRDPLISPCRCAGTLRYIHSSCLKKWIRISQRRGKKQPPHCELCHFQFNRHKRFKFSQWRWPKVRRRDKILHIIFLLNLVIMIGCAIATVMCFLSDRGNVVKFPKDKVRLTTEEVITLTCGVMFFVAFFIAMTVEIKARHTLYKLFRRFMMHNTEWTVEQYDAGKDPLYCKRGPASVV